MGLRRLVCLAVSQWRRHLRVGGHQNHRSQVPGNLRVTGDRGVFLTGQSGCDLAHAGRTARCKGERFEGYRLIALTTALLVTICGAGVGAQPASRVDVQAGAVLLNTLPGLALGGTGWISERAGVAARVYFIPGHGLAFRSPRAFAAGVRYRGFARNRGVAGDVEIDFGMGLVAMRDAESITPLPSRIRRRAVPGWRQYLTIDVLLGRRLGERFGFKVGTGLAVPAGGGGGEDSVGFVTRFLAVVPLGSF